MSNQGHVKAVSKGRRKAPGQQALRELVVYTCGTNPSRLSTLRTCVSTGNTRLPRDAHHHAECAFRADFREAGKVSNNFQSAHREKCPVGGAEGSSQTCEIRPIALARRFASPASRTSSTKVFPGAAMERSQVRYTAFRRSYRPGVRPFVRPTREHYVDNFIRDTLFVPVSRPSVPGPGGSPKILQVPP